MEAATQSKGLTVQHCLQRRAHLLRLALKWSIRCCGRGEINSVCGGLQADQYKLHDFQTCIDQLFVVFFLCFYTLLPDNSCECVRVHVCVCVCVCV